MLHVSAEKKVNHLLLSSTANSIMFRSVNILQTTNMSAFGVCLAAALICDFRRRSRRFSDPRRPPNRIREPLRVTPLFARQEIPLFAFKAASDRRSVILNDLNRYCEGEGGGAAPQSVHTPRFTLHFSAQPLITLRTNARQKTTSQMRTLRIQ